MFGPVIRAICGRGRRYPIRIIVRHEPFFDQRLLQHRMPAIANVEHAFVAHLRAAVVVQPRRFGERGQHVQLRQRRRGLLDCVQARPTLLRARARNSSYSSLVLRSSAPRILPSISFSSGVM